MRIRHIEMKITLDDGEVVEGLVGPEADQRWGNDIPHLGACVQPMADMAAALHENGHFETDEEVDEEPDDDES